MAELGTRDASLPIPVAFMALRGLHRTHDPRIAATAIGDYVTSLVAGTTYEQLAASSALAGYRDLHAARGKTGRQFLPSPESLFKLLFKRAAWRSFDAVVDAYTLVSLQTCVSIGAHDLARLRLPVALVPTVGGESVVTIGESAPVVLGANEYCYRDADGQILGRMECRQAEATKVTATTRDVLFIVQGHAALGARELHTASLLLGQTLTELVGFADAVEGPLVIE